MKRIIAGAMLALTVSGAALAQVDTAFFDGKNGYLGMKKPGNEPVVFAPGIVSEESRTEATVNFSPDGRMCVFTAGGWPNSYAMYAEFKDGAWTKPVKAWFSEKRAVCEPMFSPDGRRIYFSSDEPKGSKGSYDIWYVEKTAAGWSDLVNAGDSINTNKDEFHPNPIADGSIYFSTWNGNVAMAKATGGTLERRVTLTEPVNLRSVKNSWGDPYVSADGNLMIIMSTRPGGLGSYDGYVSFRNPDGTWGEMKNLGAPCNSKAEEHSPDLSPDGKYIFFGRNGDIMWAKADFIKKLK